MVVMSFRLPEELRQERPRRRGPAGEVPEHSWPPIDRRALAQLEADIERGWVASERGMTARDATDHPWLVAWRGLMALVEREGGPCYGTVAATSEAVDDFVEAFVGQLATAAGTLSRVSSCWAEWLLEVTSGLLGPLAPWFSEERPEHRRLHVLALVRLGRRSEAASFVEAWRDETPEDALAWLAMSRLRCDPISGAMGSLEDREAACHILDRALRHCGDYSGRSLLWLELHTLYELMGDARRSDGAWDELVRVLH